MRDCPVSCLLEAAGDDPKRNGLLDTPKRVKRAAKELQSCSNVNLLSIFGDALFEIEEQSNDDIVIVKNINFSLLNQKDFLPIFGACHVAYYPGKGRVVGLSKLARLVKAASRQLTNVEHFMSSVVNSLQQFCESPGAAILVEANQFKSSVSLRKTQRMHGTGVFKQKQQQERFLRLINCQMSDINVLPQALQSDSTTITPSTSFTSSPTTGQFSQPNRHSNGILKSISQFFRDEQCGQSCGQQFENGGSVGSGCHNIPTCKVQQRFGRIQQAASLVIRNFTGLTEQAAQDCATQYATWLEWQTRGLALSLDEISTKLLTNASTSTSSDSTGAPCYTAHERPSSSIGDSSTTNSSPTSDDTPDMYHTVVLPFVSLCEHHLFPFYGTVFVEAIWSWHVPNLANYVEQLVDVLSRRF